MRLIIDFSRRKVPWYMFGLHVQRRFLTRSKRGLLQFSAAYQQNQRADGINKH